MNNDQKIIKILEALQSDIQDVKQTQQEHGKRLSNMEITQENHGTVLGQIKTAVETLDAGQQAHRSEMNMRFQDLNAKFGQKVGSLERRVNKLEELEGVPNPDKH